MTWGFLPFQFGERSRCRLLAVQAKNESPAFSLHCSTVLKRESQLEGVLTLPGILAVKALSFNLNILGSRQIQGHIETCIPHTFPAEGNVQVERDFVGSPVLNQDILIGNVARPLYNAASDGERNAAHGKRLQSRSIGGADKHLYFNGSTQVRTRRRRNRERWSDVTRRKRHHRCGC